ncbi:RBBP9/YdeN family alpha/beta hydrolase [Arcobacter sp. YIC-464]|uniref:RBBP9/YdeN family alpha/beta hydrolase n=1 Tax=Arcobacter sp. YIC-464 TaxID=3376631 RepID=UPI003C1D834C
MQRILILHGLGGSDYPHWQAVLAADLIKQNYIVSFPAFPKRDNPQLEEWQEFLKKEIEHFKPDTVICHSLANVLWFQTCDELDISLEKLMLVAPVSRTRVVEAAKTFYPYNPPKNLKAKKVIMLASTNDPYMTEDEAMQLKEDLQVEVNVMKDAGHINADSGFGSHDFALDWLTKDKNDKGYF